MFCTWSISQVVRVACASCRTLVSFSKNGSSPSSRDPSESSDDSYSFIIFRCIDMLLGPAHLHQATLYDTKTEKARCPVYLLLPPDAWREFESTTPVRLDRSERCEAN
ncbi:hypothetical protein A9K55_000441 [Cordyceps militaris]|uniref:Uncharacterized protein n=1 Tax=Cordyceps militaris TaxID=73501 RepID=A0A2H4SWJ4_CORMI|nr:hypothetical protein A9K55_000441 [Cordyceps militaris]